MHQYLVSLVSVRTGHFSKTSGSIGSSLGADERHMSSMSSQGLHVEVQHWLAQFQNHRNSELLKLVEKPSLWISDFLTFIGLHSWVSSAMAVIHTTSKVLISQYDRAARNHSANLHHLQRDEGVPHPQPTQNDERCLENRLRSGF